MRDGSELGGAAICCLLHDLSPGGTAWQWVRLLARHVERGGRATIFSPDGPLATPARVAGIETVATAAWAEGDTTTHPDLWAAVAAHDVAVVHWEQGVMEAFAPALEACGRAALALHQSPRAMVRWFGPPTLATAQATLEMALREPSAVALVRGEAHRRQVAASFGVPAAPLRILPASIPPASAAPPAARGAPREVLAMTRMSPEKAAIVKLAIALTQARLEGGEPCRLTLAGEGPWQAEAVELCAASLPKNAWRAEGAPANPIARLAATDVVVAQGVTTLEAAALGRRVVVARLPGEAAAGAVLTPENYDDAAHDPFGEPALTSDVGQLWREIDALDAAQLAVLRHLVEANNSIEAALRALDEALATAAGPGGPDHPA